MTYQILTNDDEVCIPSLSSILLAVQDTEAPTGLLRNHKQVQGHLGPQPPGIPWFLVPTKYFKKNRWFYGKYVTVEATQTGLAQPKK